MACVTRGTSCGRGYYSTTFVSGTNYAQLLTSGGSLCIPCPDLCSDCTGASRCTGCKHGLLMTSTSSLECCSTKDSGCSTCHTECNGCNGPTSRDCIKCHSANISDVNGSICVPVCTKANTYLAPTGNEYLCTPCDVTCNECTGPGPNSCIQCSFYNTSTISGNSSNECVITCPDGYYGDDEGYCRPCHEECITCTSEHSVNCTACRNDEIILSDGLKQCIPKCSFAHKYRTGSAKCELQWYVHMHVCMYVTWAGVI